MIIWLPIALVVMVLMDLWAGLLHGRLWHHFLWRIHRSHHEPRTGRWEKNDALALFHAPIAIALIVWGGPPGNLRNVDFGIGIGMTLFAVGYMLVHDGIVHGRLPVSGLLRFRVVRGIVRAHNVHHRTGAVPYGLFFGVRELRRHRSATSRRKKPSATPSGARGPASPSATPPDDEPPSFEGTSRAREAASRP